MPSEQVSSGNGRIDGWIISQRRPRYVMLAYLDDAEAGILGSSTNLFSIVAV